MFVPSTIQNHLARLGIAGIGRDRRRAHSCSVRRRVRLGLEGLEQRCLLSGISGFTEYPLPAASAGDTGIVAGADGNLWFIENSANKIGMINPTTHAVSEFPIPTANANPWGIAAGADGNIWFTERNAGKIGTINLTTHAITEFATPTAGSGPVGIAAGPDGNVWFTEANGSFQIGMINPTTHAINNYPIPASFNAHPFWITGGPDGNIWLSFEGSSWIARFNPTTHAVTGFRAPGTSAGYADVYHVTAGPDGNVWFTDYNASAVGMINPTTGVISEYLVPIANSSPYGITAGPDGNIWFTDSGEIGQINPTTDSITNYPIDQGVNQITGGPDGNLWFTDPGNNAVGVANLTTSQLVVTTQPPATMTAGTNFGLTVEAEDGSGNLLSSFNGTVNVAIASDPGGTTLGGTLTATASGGFANFTGLTLNKAASGYTLVVSASGLGAGVSSAITVTPAAATQVVVTEQPPASVTAGTGFSLEAAIEDAYGNVETGDNTDVVRVALAGGPAEATLGGTLSATASNGVATFTGLTLTQAASGYTLQASSSGLSSATSSAVTVTPAAATQLVITQQPPASVTLNSAFGLQGTIEDAYGNVETSSSSTVKVALASNPGGAKLGGTLSVKASEGVASFSGLTLNKVGTGYTLQVTSNALSSVVTSAINVTKNGASNPLAVAAAASTPELLMAPLVLDSPGFLDSLGLKKRPR